MVGVVEFFSPVVAEPDDRLLELRRPGRAPAGTRDRARSPRARDRAPGRGADALRDRARARERRAQGVRLRRLARPHRAAADDRGLRPAPQAALRGPAGRVGRRVHRLHRRRDGAHAGPDRGAPVLLADRALGAGRDPRRPERHAEPSDRRACRRDRGVGSRDRDGRAPGRRRRRDSAQPPLREPDLQRGEVQRAIARLSSRSAPSSRAAPGTSSSPTTGSASTSATASASSTSSSACTAPASTRARASGSRSARRSSSATAAASGSRKRRAAAARSSSSCPDSSEEGRPVMPVGRSVLLVEDKPADVRLTEEVLKQGKVANELFVAEDGEKAMQFLRQRGRVRRSAAARPGDPGPQPAADGRQGGSPGDQERPGLPQDPRADPDHLSGRAGHPRRVRPPRERVHHQADRPRRVRQLSSPRSSSSGFRS